MPDYPARPMGYLERVFRESAEENCRAILELAQDAAPGGRMLDLGCADGVFTMRVAQAAGATEVHGVEFVDSWAAGARERGVEVLVADLGKPLPYEDASFDLIHSNQVIEHLQRTDLFLMEIRRLLKPSGRAVLSTNNLSSWHNVVSLAMGWQPFPSHVSDYTVVGNPVNTYEGMEQDTTGQLHLRVFTGRALAELAGYHGLVLEQDASNGYYPLGGSLARTAARIDRRHTAFLAHRYAPGESRRRHEPTGVTVAT